MNIYLRYFDTETLVTTLEEAFDFLQSLPEISIDDYLKKDITQFVESDAVFPKRYKVSGKNYFIVIKTMATTMEEFKLKGTAAREAAQEDKQRIKCDAEEIVPGWYEANIVFNRVVPIPQTQKFQYVETEFAARLKALSRQDCYNRLIDHLRSRQDVDPRCQFPSQKSRNFDCSYLGLSI